MATARVGIRRHCCARFNLREKDGRMFEMSRLDFSRRILRDLLGFVPAEINCLVVLPQGRGFDVSFKNSLLLNSFWQKYEKVADKLAMFNLDKLTDDSIKTAIVRMYNETVEQADITTWLSRFCEVRGPARKVFDVDGIWTCVWRVPIRLLSDPEGYEGRKAPPVYHSFG